MSRSRCLLRLVFFFNKELQHLVGANHLASRWQHSSLVAQKKSKFKVVARTLSGDLKKFFCMLHMFLLFSHHIYAWIYNIYVLISQKISNLPFQIDFVIYTLYLQCHFHF